MSDGYVTEAFETTGGTTWYKANDSAGRTYHVKKGEGQVSQQQYAAARSHRPEVAAAERGESVDLSNTETYSASRTAPTAGLERGSVEYRLGVNKNRWLGFKFSPETPDDDAEAFESYSQMVDQLRDADSREEREGIRRQYGLGGS